VADIRQQTITQLLAMLNTKLIRFWYRSVMVPDRAHGLRSNWKAAIKAICEGSADRASAAMRKYHQDAMAALKHVMQLRSGGDVT